MEVWLLNDKFEVLFPSRDSVFSEGWGVCGPLSLRKSDTERPERRNNGVRQDMGAGAFSVQDADRGPSDAFARIGEGIVLDALDGLDVTLIELGKRPPGANGCPLVGGREGAVMPVHICVYLWRPKPTTFFSAIVKTPVLRASNNLTYRLYF